MNAPIPRAAYKVMPYADRRRWVLEWLRANKFADCMNRDFVEDFAEATRCKYVASPWGAGWCRQLTEDLLRMHREGDLRRWRVGLGSAWQPGMPKWVWSYGL